MPAKEKEITFAIVEEIGVISSSATGWNREINIVKWNNGNPKLDIRDWSPDHTKMGKGISLKNEEVALLRNLLEDFDLDKI
ncbi:MAG: YdbC family protein [Saccharofermentanales bacterium]